MYYGCNLSELTSCIWVLHAFQFNYLDSFPPCTAFLMQPSHTKELITRLQNCSDEELVGTLKSITIWKYGKVNLWF